MPDIQFDHPYLESLPLFEGKRRLGLGSIVFESKLGEGGMGAVFLAHHMGLDIPVVAKVMAKKHVKDLGSWMQREARALSKIRHMNVIGILDYVEVDEVPFLIMEYIAGVSLGDRIKERPMSEGPALDILLPIAEGLAEVWRAGFLHSDIKPDNIFIPTEGPPKLFDLGLARLRDVSDPIIPEGVAAGTPHYISPEMARGDRAIGIQSDMYSFGATLFHVLTGKQPFQGSTPAEIMTSHLKTDPPHPKNLNPLLSEASCQLILKLLKKKPEDRFATSESFLAALRDVRNQATRLIESKHIETVAETEQTVMGSAGLAPASSRRDSGIGDMIGNCRLVAKAGAGAFGVVFRARHTVLDIDVAVKLLPADLAEKDRLYIDLFLREARTAARIRHPNVIGIYEAGNFNGQYYLIMEYAPGGTVASLMAANGGKLAPGQAIQIMTAIAKGLSAAATLNIIHRDIKPDNIMFGANGDVKIADLGLAKRLRPLGDASVSVDESMVSQHGGGMRGTPAYMAPEIASEEQNVDARADLYSLGAMGYHMLTGRTPFQGSMMQVLLKHSREMPVSPQSIEPGIPLKLSDIIMRLLAKQPQERFDSAETLLDALAHCMS